MILIPGGMFRMGELNREGIEYENALSHSVTITPFKLGKYEVTFAQWDACVAEFIRSAYRAWAMRSSRGGALGFRLAQDQ